MTKITPDHLARSAFVYIRQSTADQVLNNHESRLRQYGLVERARQLGCQSASKIDPQSAFNFDPFGQHDLAVLDSAR
jgi:hypothetical protein